MRILAPTCESGRASGHAGRSHSDHNALACFADVVAAEWAIDPRGGEVGQRAH